MINIPGSRVVLDCLWEITVLEQIIIKEDLGALRFNQSYTKQQAILQ